MGTSWGKSSGVFKFSKSQVIIIKQTISIQLKSTRYRRSMIKDYQETTTKDSTNLGSQNCVLKCGPNLRDQFESGEQ